MPARIILCQTIIGLGHTLKMTVTAEGVETELQAETLRSMNCDVAQGYQFGRPMPETDIAALIIRRFARDSVQAAAFALEHRQIA